MKKLLCFLLVGILSLPLLAEGEPKMPKKKKKIYPPKPAVDKKKLSCEDWQKRELERKIDQYRRNSKVLRHAKLSKCDLSSPEIVQKVARKSVEIRKKLGDVLGKLADAYEKDDKKTIKEKNEEKWQLQQELKVSDREKHIMYRLAEIERMGKELPDSEEMKSLLKKAKEDSTRYIQVTKDIIAKESEQRQLEIKLRRMVREVDIIKRKAQLKKMQEKIDNDIE